MPVEKKAIWVGTFWSSTWKYARGFWMVESSSRQERSQIAFLVFVGRALYDDVIWLNEEMIAYKVRPSSQNWLDEVYRSRAEYRNAADAREKAVNAAGEAYLGEKARARHKL